MGNYPAHRMAARLPLASHLDPNLFHKALAEARRHWTQLPTICSQPRLLDCTALGDNQANMAPVGSRWTPPGQLRLRRGI